MIRGSILAVCALAALSALPASAQTDPRLQTREYDPAEVVRIAGRLGVQATIAFGEGESIENVAVGDSQQWQITPNKRADLLFVKPLTASAKTNMTVVTNRHTYFFDLVASARSEPLYMLRFTYKEEEEAAPTTVMPNRAETSVMPERGVLAALNAEREAVLETDRPDVITGEPKPEPDAPAVLNFAWKREGDASLMPARIYDDGKATYLSWASDQSVPAILVRNAEGKEGPVNYAVRGSTIVIDTVPSLIVLRTGDESATLENMRSPADSAAASDTPVVMPKTSAKPYFAAVSRYPFVSSLRRN